MFPAAALKVEADVSETDTLIAVLPKYTLFPPAFTSAVVMKMF